MSISKVVLCVNCVFAIYYGQKPVQLPIFLACCRFVNQMGTQCGACSVVSLRKARRARIGVLVAWCHSSRLVGHV